MQGKRSWVIPDEKYSRRLDKLSGDTTLYRSWVFDLTVALNQLDPDLAKEGNNVLNERGNEREKWEHEGKVDPVIWEKYHSELYAVISGLISVMFLPRAQQYTIYEKV